jgi:DNA replication protein DnaC
MADLIADLKHLRLYGMAACYAEGLEQGQLERTPATALLAQLVQAEATDRATRSMRYQMHVARFPMHRDLAGFDFEQTKVDRRQITSFATTAFTEQAENIVLIGGTGTGKTHLATALGVEAVTRHGKRVRFYSTVELVNTLEQEKASGRAGRLAHQLMHLDCVFRPIVNTHSVST